MKQSTVVPMPGGSPIKKNALRLFAQRQCLAGKPEGPAGRRVISIFGASKGMDLKNSTSKE
ncbi:MAG: hypothetical protein WBG94_18965 [Anaerolineales bacterium]